MNTSFPLQDKTILVTGGTGSFGKTFVRKALTEHCPATVSYTHLTLPTNREV